MSKCFTILLAGDLRMGLGMGNEQDSGSPGADGVQLTNFLKRFEAPLAEGAFSVILSSLTPYRRAQQGGQLQHPE